MTPLDLLTIGLVSALAWSCRDLGWRQVALILSTSITLGVILGFIGRSSL
jgi:hypothetical protein